MSDFTQITETCRACNGSGRMVRDPDIGTDQECFVCEGSGKLNADVRATYIDTIRHLVECGASHGLLADDYCSQIIEVLNSIQKESPLSDVRATVGDQDKINVLYAMVEGLHAMIYGTYTINSGDFALKALGDGGSIHEYVHAMMLLLPERCYEQIQSGGEVAADKGEASHTDLEKWRKDHLPEQVGDEAMAKAIADGTEGELIASRVLSQSNGSDK